MAISWQGVAIFLSESLVGRKGCRFHVDPSVIESRPYGVSKRNESKVLY